MLLGVVGHSCWHTPHPMHPSGFTAIFPFFNSMAADPSGQRSTQIVQFSPLLRTHVFSHQTAVPISISPTGVNFSAPLGQTCMQFKPLHTTQADTSGSINGNPPAFLPEES